jgi:hypothetical protein
MILVAILKRSAVWKLYAATKGSSNIGDYTNLSDVIK